MVHLKKPYHLLELSILLIFIVSCRKDLVIEPVAPTVEEVPYEPDLPEEPYDYEGIEYPQNFLDDPLLGLFNTLNDGNQVTNEGATLGRVLFYDRNLSANNTISCASCHHQDKGFTDGVDFSVGFEGGHTGRNSMSIVNVNFQRRFFWDNRANTIENQVLMPIQDPVEMGMDLGDLVEKLSLIEYYPPLFYAAFGDSSITIETISFALAQFLKSMRSFNSKYDQGLNSNFDNFTTLEEQGRDLFTNGGFGCINCHITPNLGGVTSDINGLDSLAIDPGVGGITGDEDDMGRFKSVSLRNVELTAPYMHDGRFATLREVIEFYSTGVQPHPFLDDRLTTDFSVGGTPKILNLSDQEIDAMVAFLKTFTDWDFINNPIYSNPFPE